MWHWTFNSGVRPRPDDLLKFARAWDHAFRVQNSTSNSGGPVKPVPGESLLSPSISVDYSDFLAKPLRTKIGNLILADLQLKCFSQICLILITAHRVTKTLTHQPVCKFQLSNPTHKLIGLKLKNLTHVKFMIT